MSVNFRPVNEVWGEHSSCFVEPELLSRVLHKLSEFAGCPSEAHEYGDMTSVWIEDGRKLLDFISNERLFTAERMARPLGLKGARHLNDLKFLVSNMRILAEPWRTSIDAHGALTFYIDAY